MVMDRPDSRHLQVQVPIGGMPQALVHAADVQERVTSDGRGRHGNEILHQQTFEQKLAGDRSLARRQRTAPDPEPLASAVDEISWVEMHDSIGSRREPAAQCGTAARQPQIVDMQHRDPIRPSLLDAETSLGYPRAEIRPPMNGKRQPSGEALGDLHAGLGIAAVNEDDLDPGFMLLDDGLQRFSKPALAVPARHDDRKPGVCHCPAASPIYCESWFYGLIMTPCPVSNDNTLTFRNSERSASSPSRHRDGVDAPRRHRCAKVVVLSNH